MSYFNSCSSRCHCWLVKVGNGSGIFVFIRARAKKDTSGQSEVALVVVRIRISKDNVSLTKDTKANKEIIEVVDIGGFPVEGDVIYNRLTLAIYNTNISINNFNKDNIR